MKIVKKFLKKLVNNIKKYYKTKEIEYLAKLKALQVQQ